MNDTRVRHRAQCMMEEIETETETTTMPATLTSSGHLTGMLDRDQRTAKLRIFDRPVFVLNRSTSSVRTAAGPRCWPVPGGGVAPPLSHRRPRPRPRSRLPGRTSPRAPCRTGNGGSSWKRPHSLQFIVIAIVCLSVFHLPNSARAAPVRRSVPKNMENRMDSRQKWINPCGFAHPRGEDQEITLEMSSEKDMISVIASQADIAYTRVKHFAENYALKTFQMDMNQLHESRKDWRYEWLPSKDQVPKDLFEPVPIEHLETLELDEVLLNTYEYLQRLAVGMEQMVWDQQDNHGEFKEEMRRHEHNLNNVLCELQAMIYQKNIQMRPDITRDVMGAEYRKPGTQTDINNRDWIILRDYMNVLEYVKEVFTHLTPV